MIFGRVSDLVRSSLGVGENTDSNSVPSTNRGASGAKVAHHPCKVKTSDRSRRGPPYGHKNQQNVAILFVHVTVQKGM